MSASKREVILVNISGNDKPGLTTALSQVLAQYDVRILDIGQANIHDDLALGMMFEVPASAESAPILKDLLFKAYELDVNIRFTPISEEEYTSWVNQQGKDRYIVTLLSRKLTAAQLTKVTNIIAEQNLNIDLISRLSGRPGLGDTTGPSRAVVQFSVRGFPENTEEMKRQFMDVSRETGIDIAFQTDNIYRRNRRLVCFDMDSTLIQTEVIDELAERAGVGDQVRKITEAAMRGELDFSESFKERIALLKGLDEGVMHDVAVKLPLTEGCERLISTLKKYGYKTAILSGGFTFFGRYLQNKLGVDYVYANELEIIDGKLTGKHLGEIVDGERKAFFLKNIAEKERIHLEQVIAIGDGSNDLPMIQLAGLGIAFHAKPKVKASASHAISNIGLDAVLYLLGFRDREINL